MQTAAGVSYAVANRDVLRNEELGLVYGLEPGNEQLLNGKEADSKVSVWVSNLGFFYVLAPCHAHSQPEVLDASIKALGTLELPLFLVASFCEAEIIRGDFTSTVHGGGRLRSL